LRSRKEGNESFNQLSSRLENAARESDSQVQGLVERAWLLGPHHVGPNLLLTSTRSDTSSLFDLPKSTVVQLGKRPGKQL